MTPLGWLSDWTPWEKFRHQRGNVLLLAAVWFLSVARAGPSALFTNLDIRVVEREPWLPLRFLKKRINHQLPQDIGA
jgi:hypothetical protein